MRGNIPWRAVLVFSVAAVILGVAAGPADAGDFTVAVSVTGSHGGDRYGKGMISLIDGSGINQADASDPATWTVAYNNYPDEWMGQFFPAADPEAEPPVPGALNSKLAWASFDLGASTALSDFYLWNIRYGGGVAGTATYNLYYADSPTVALPAQPNKGAWSVTGLTPEGDYDFVSGGGWTLFNTSGVLSLSKSSDTILDLSGVTARYIAVEILTNHGDTYGGGRVGFLETAFTTFVSEMTWVGQGGDVVDVWSVGENWDDAIYTDRDVIIDTAGSEVTVDAAATAARVTVGENNASSLVIAGGSTLTVSHSSVDSALRVGEFGAVTIDGTLEAPSLLSSGAVTINPTADLTAVNLISLSGASGTVSAPSGIALKGNKLLLDNTINSNDRMNDSDNVTLSLGGELYMKGSNSGTTESFGVLEIAGGYSTVTVEETTRYKTATLTGSDFSRTGSGTALIRGTLLGQNHSYQGGRVTFGDVGGLSLVGATTLDAAANNDVTKTVAIVPYLIGGTSHTDTGSTFVTYDTTLGFRALNTNNQFTALTSDYVTPATHENVKGFNGTIIASAPSVNSLLFNSGNQTLDGSGTLTVDSGAVALVGTGNVTIGSGFSAVTLGDGAWNEGIITVKQNTMTINAPVDVTGGGLTKSGAGKLTLTAENLYAGDTVINAGTLSISTAYLDDGADVYLYTGSIFELMFAETDIISELFFDGEAQDTGIWGALGSGADFESDFFTGTGLLQVTGGVVLGDADGDGDVDAADYIMVKKHFGSAPAAGTEGSGGDFDGDGTVDWDDLQTMQAAFNTGAGAGTPIPEPASLLIVLAAGLPAMLKRRRRRR